MRRALLLTVLLGLLVPASAQAALSAGGRRVLNDCRDNLVIEGRYSQSDYQNALANLPSDVREYSDCPDVIRAARRRDLRYTPPSPGGGSSGGGFGGGAGPAPPASGAPPPARPGAAAALSAAQNGGQPVTIDGAPITPGASGLAASALRHAVPTPLLLVLVLLGLGALATTLQGARARGLRAPAPLLRGLDRLFPRRA